MGGITRFLLPEDVEAVIRIINTVPNTWRWFDGLIRFPEDQTKFRQIAHGTGYYISRYNDSQPAIMGEAVKGTSPVIRRTPDYRALMVDGKLPSFIAFQMAGYNSPEVFNMVREVAVAYIRRGYVGWINFVKSDFRQDADQNPARCDFRIAPKKSESSEIALKWDKEFGGEPSDLAPIFAACANEKLVNPDVRRDRFT